MKDIDVLLVRTTEGLCIKSNISIVNEYIETLKELNYQFDIDIELVGVIVPWII